MELDNQDIENSYIYFTTNSKAGSNNKTVIYFYDNSKVPSKEAGSFSIWFLSPHIKYYLMYCRGWTRFYTTMPTQAEKVWTLEKRGDRIRVFCNSVLVVDITLSDTTCDIPEWRTYWRGRVTGVKFSSRFDDASENYLIGQLLFLYILYNYHCSKKGQV